jgi:membrane protein implicated in regulation of membrane protease activity
MDFQTWMWAIWLGVFVLSLVIEAIGTDLVSVWFAAGSLVALIVSFIPGVQWWIQLIVFLAVSVASLLCLRPLVHRYMRRDIINSNIDEIKGKKGLLVEKIDRLHQGVCKINDVSWTAIAQDDKEKIPEGSTVEVLAVSGNKLIVKKVEDTEGEKTL